MASGDRPYPKAPETPQQALEAALASLEAAMERRWAKEASQPGPPIERRDDLFGKPWMMSE